MGRITMGGILEKCRLRFALLFLLLLCGCVKTSYQEPAQNSDERLWYYYINHRTTHEFRLYLLDPLRVKFKTEALRGIEENRWALAREINTVHSYRRYLDDYPNGIHSESAEELVLKTTTADIHFDQTHQAVKLKNWSYLSELINFSKSHTSSKYFYDAFEHIVEILDENFPRDRYNSSYRNIAQKGANEFHQMELLKNLFSKAMENGTSFPVVFASKVQRQGRASILIQELGGQELVVTGASTLFKATNCARNGWEEKFGPDKSIMPYGNTEISLRYSIQCHSFKYFGIDVYFKTHRNEEVEIKIL
jgi:hypothetical protein